MTREIYCPEKVKGLEMIPIENKTIVLPFKEDTYDDVFAEKAAYRAFITEQMQQYPELFPPSMKDGWSFYGVTQPSTKHEG